MMNKDAREVLQEEINESSLRLKQAKFGHKLTDIVPDHTNNYYLPDKKSYFPKEKKSISQSTSSKNFGIKGNSPMLNTRKTTDFRANSSINNEQSSMFITEPPNQQQAATQIRKPTNTF